MGVVRYEGLPFVARFRWNTGKIMEKFYGGFAERQILAAKCENCGYTVVRKKLDGKGGFVTLDKPEVIAAVKLNGADSMIFAKIGDVDVEDIKNGMEVVPVWAEKPEGRLSDLLYFRPG